MSLANGESAWQSKSTLLVFFVNGKYIFIFKSDVCRSSSPQRTTERWRRESDIANALPSISVPWMEIIPLPLTPAHLLERHCDHGIF